MYVMGTWLITGCSGGLGESIARAALEHGENVAVTARNSEKVQELVRPYSDHGIALRLDLNDWDSMKKAVTKACGTFGGIDVLVNNAGHGYRAAVEESEPERIRELFDTNFFAPAELMNTVLPVMRRQKKGLIVNVTSIGAVRGALGNGYYSAAKAALELLTEALAGSERKIADYDVLAPKYRKENMEDRHDQAADPARGGRVIVETALSGKLPSRLLLGSEAAKAAEAVMENRLEEIRQWMEVSRQADFQ